MSSDAGKETLGFQTEVKQILDLMIHSLYSNKEVFLRELISNASDALDKLRFEALSNEALYESDSEPGIHIEYDKQARTVTVRDNGVGMGYAEIKDNLGTIARSGTKEFFQALTGDQAHDTQLVGQFGVGFYSSFIVADRVTVTSRRAGVPEEGGVRWESTGEGDYTVERRKVLRRGTEVVLHLREGEDEFLEGYRLRGIVHRFSDHISFPISMPEEGQDARGTEVVNKATALWTRSKREIKDEEYNEFYKHVAHDIEDPLARLHSRVEGKLEYTALLYIPARAPFDLFDRSVRHGVNLYVRRVFIMDDAEQLMPPYLRFVRGIIDSADLPLNVSRELLQKNRQIDAIRGGCVKKVLDLLTGMADKEPEKYASFWKELGQVLKEGIIDDAKNREQIAKLLRFATTRPGGQEQSVSLDAYAERMQEGQDKIYYITADNYQTALNSPHLEVFRARGIEVLLLTDQVDEWVVHHLDKFADKELRSVAKGELDLETPEPEDGETKVGKDGGSEDALIERFKQSLGSRVKDVRITRRLTTSPACLVADQQAMDRHLERLLRAAGQKIDASQPIMEINAEHPMVRRFAAEEDGERRTALAELLFDQALLSEGGRLDDPAGFVHRMNELFLALAGEPVESVAQAHRVSSQGESATPAAQSGDAEQVDQESTASSEAE